jgi:hypothetical protein
MLLSIDFDFFVREDPLWDLGHIENEFFMDLIWRARPHLLGLMKAEGHRGFWDQLRKSFTFDREIFVSESHLEAYNFVQPFEQIILIDAHHDCWQKEDPLNITCDSWAYYATHVAKCELIWVHPPWVDPTHMEIPSHVRGQVRTMTMEALCENFECHIDKVHVCRSGCWIPPWLDQEFIEFVNSAGFSKTTTVGRFEPMKKRWADAEISQLHTLKQLAESQRQR